MNDLPPRQRRREPTTVRRLPEKQVRDRTTLDAWRARCHELPADFHEELRHGMPCYVRGGDVELAFASQKRYLSFYVLRSDVMDAHRDRLSGHSVGKGCVRFPRGRPVDLELVASLVRATGATSGPVC